MEDNKGLEAIAIMCLNRVTGTWGFNAEKMCETCIISDTAEFWNYLM